MGGGDGERAGRREREREDLGRARGERDLGGNTGKILK
jgi:hypothetical protein